MTIDKFAEGIKLAQQVLLLLQIGASVEKNSCMVKSQNFVVVTFSAKIIFWDKKTRPVLFYKEKYEPFYRIWNALARDQ